MKNGDMTIEKLESVGQVPNRLCRGLGTHPRVLRKDLKDKIDVKEF